MAGPAVSRRPSASPLCTWHFPLFTFPCQICPPADPGNRGMMAASGIRQPGCRRPRAPKLYVSLGVEAGGRGSDKRFSSAVIKGGISWVMVLHRMSRLMSKYAWIRRFRMPTMSSHGTCGCLFRVSSDTLVAASPTISMHFTRESASIRLESKSGRDLPLTNSRASFAASSICRRRTRSGFGVLHLGAGHDVVSKIPAQIRRRPQIHFPARKMLRQLPFHPRHPQKTGCPAGLKLDQHVHIAVGTEPVREHRSEQRKLPNVIPPAKCSNPFSRKIETVRFHCETVLNPNRQVKRTAAASGFASNAARQIGRASCRERV